MVVITTVLVLYCFVVILLCAGWGKAVGKRRRSDEPSIPLVSVIVPFRNEEKNLKRLLASLQAQTYANFEIILIDDHSHDRSSEIATESGIVNLNVVKNKGEGKKNAITTGIQAAKGSLIVTTDADCILPDRWLSEIHLYFMDEQVKLVFGGVRIHPDKNFFSILQSIEFASLIGSGAATAALGFPTMCNGANLAYRKSAFEQVNGYDGNLAIASGDDEFLMRKIHQRFPDSVRFLNSQDAVVETAVQPDLFSFFRQRFRWASKWRYNSSVLSIGLSIFILLTQISWMGALLSLVISFHTGIFFAGMIKILAEAVFLFRICRWLKVKWSWSAFIVLQVCYPVYVITVGIASNFLLKTWKGRNI
jgi:cellulose synthase/poly-beta-1,6-N-acetylglucosamine synthase-like glycosyltransferase